MKFDRNHRAIKIALASAKDARGNVSDQTRFGAIRTFGEKLSDAIGEAGNRPRSVGNREPDKQQDYLKALRALGLISKTEFDDFDIVREIGNKGAHGDEIYPRSRREALAAFERLARNAELVAALELNPLRTAETYVQKTDTLKIYVDEREVSLNKRRSDYQPDSIKNGNKNITSRNSKSLNEGFLIVSILLLFPFISHVVSVVFATEVSTGSLKMWDITKADIYIFSIPVLNWLVFLTTTITHTFTSVFFDNSQASAIWIGHLSAFGFFYGFWIFRSHTSFIIIPSFLALAYAALMFDLGRERPGDRELDAIIQQVGFRTYSNTLNFPNQPGNVTLTLTSDGESLKLDSLSAGHTCSYLVSADGLKGSRVALELEVVGGDCRELTGEVYSNGQIIDFDLFTGNNRRVPMQFRINLNE